MTHVRTFSEDIRACSQTTCYGSTPDAEYAYTAMATDLAYVVRSYCYGDACMDGEITVERIVRDRAGYASEGGMKGVYYGHDGLCLYRVDMPDGHMYTARAADRQTLRAALKRLFPDATVAR